MKENNNNNVIMKYYLIYQCNEEIYNENEEIRD